MTRNGLARITTKLKADVGRRSMVGAAAMLGAVLVIVLAAPDTSTDAVNEGPFAFNCNAGNTGNAGIVDGLSKGPMLVSEVLDGIVTRYNGAEAQSLQRVVVRIRDGRTIVASSTSGALSFRAGDTLDGRQMGLPSRAGLLPEAGRRVSASQVRFVQAHVDARAFMAAVESGRGDTALQALGLRSQDVLVVATVPSERTSRTQFTMHPVVLVLQ